MPILEHPNFMYFESLVLLIFILIVLFCANVRYWKPRIINRLSLIYISIAVTAVLKAAWSLVDGYNYDAANKALTVIASIMITVAAFFYLSFIFKHAETVIKVSKVWYIVALSLIGVVALFEIVSIWTGWSFRINDEHHCVREGFLSFINLIVCGLYLIVGVVFALISATKVKLLSERYKFVTVALSTIPCIVLTILHFVIPYPNGLPLVFYGVLLSLLVLFVVSSAGRVTRDPLTGLLNRFAFDALLLQAMNKNRNNQSDLWLFVLDINGFKGINDTFGHPVGDDVLVQFSNILETIGDKNNATVGRWGGDEFVIFMESDEATVKDLAKTIKETVVRECNADKRFRVSVSVGYTKLREYQTMKHFFEEADHKLYEDKRRFHSLADKSKD